MQTKDYLFVSDFDQTLSFNDSGIALSELIGAGRGIYRSPEEAARDRRRRSSTISRRPLCCLRSSCSQSSSIQSSVNASQGVRRAEARGTSSA